MILPNADNAFVEASKIASYLLAFEHPEGGSKAEFFYHFGFAAEFGQLLANALVAHGQTNPVSTTAETKYGIKYRVDGPLVCPDGRTPSVRTVWIVEAGNDNPRLITAHPF